MPKEKKLSMDELIQKADAAKKKNPLDLSSDQDLSIAVMNLISIEEHFFFSGAKTSKPGFFDLKQIARRMRTELMEKLVNRNVAGEGAEIWCLSKHLLAASMRLIEVGDKAAGAGDQTDANNMFGKAYDLYSLFWGLNMGLIDLGGVQKDDTISPALKEWIAEASNDNKKSPKGKAPTPSVGVGVPQSAGVVDKKSADKGLLSGLGNWVKKSVNCCIE